MMIETLLDCLERGSKARLLGSSSRENPYLKPYQANLSEDDRIALREAWAFGWNMEDSVRRIDTRLQTSLTKRAAYAPADRGAA